MVADPKVVRLQSNINDLAGQPTARAAKQCQELTRSVSNRKPKLKTKNAAPDAKRDGVPKARHGIPAANLTETPLAVKEFIPNAWGAIRDANGKCLIVPRSQAVIEARVIERAKRGPLYCSAGDAQEGLIWLVAAIVARDRWTFSYGCPDCQARHWHRLRASDLRPKRDGRQDRQTSRESHCPLRLSRHVIVGPVVHLLILPETGR